MSPTSSFSFVTPITFTGNDLNAQYFSEEELEAWVPDELFELVVDDNEDGVNAGEIWEEEEVLE